MNDDSYMNALRLIVQLRAEITALRALSEWCKPDEHSPPEHWAAYRAFAGREAPIDS